MTLSKREREALFIHAEGLSEASGTPLGPDWEADHKVPRAAGGPDDILNMQALTRDENRAKSSAHPPTLRPWQQDFLLEWQRKTCDNFLLVALPGTGKTIAALTIVKKWIDENPARRRVVVVVPTDWLRTNWQNEAARLFGVQLQTKEFTSWKRSMVGAVVTYQSLANSETLWKLRCRDSDVLMVCDEIHHASDENDWGGQLKEAFSLAKRRLLMSGTPFRGDRSRIPFVDYDASGFCVHDYRYDYPQAIRDGVIRFVRFAHDRGIVRRLSSGVEIADELSSEMSDEAATAIFTRLLQPGHFTEELLRRADAELRECRKRMPNAGAIAICKDQSHAEHIARQLTRITGVPPDLVISDDERATSTVDGFRKSDRSWVVAVKQISEGVDIKRLMVLAYLTSAKTLTFFHQAVGRIVRNMGTEHDMEAYCFIPDHPVLVKHALNITSAQDQAVLDESDHDFERRADRILQPGLWPDIVLGTEHTGQAGTIIDGSSLTPDQALEVRALKELLGASCTEHLALRVKQMYGWGTAPKTPNEGIRGHERPLENQLDDARTALAKMVGRVAYKLHSDDDKKFMIVNAQVNTYVGKRREDFDLTDCQRAIAFLRSLIAKVSL